jgi:hypothetical protein
MRKRILQKQSFAIISIMFSLLSGWELKADSQDSLLFRDHIFRATIHTVILQQEGVDGSIPMIELNSNTRLHLQFDDLDPTQRMLYYSIQHCNADWKPSNVMISKAIRGLQQDILQDFEYSFNTRQQYIHYSLVFPSDQMQILISGNYILKVFEDGDPRNVVLTKRFMVYQKTASIGALARRPVPVSLMDTHQEIDVTVDISKLSLVNPNSSTKLIIRQNGRWDNAIELKPFSMNQQTLTYNYDDGSNCFQGGNEFRWVDIRSLRMQSDRVQRFLRDSEIVVTQLLVDPMRTFDSYRSLPDANGKFFIRNSEGTEPQVDADYSWVNFTLPFEAPLTHGNLYLFGSLCDWQFQDAFKLHYDYPSKSYRARILLKQGIYYYSYVLLPNNKASGDISYVEGSHFQTENDYLILFYSRQYTEVYDELIGMTQINYRGTR